MASFGEFTRGLVDRMNQAATTGLAEEKTPEFSKATIAVVQLLQENPLLAVPCLHWLQQKRSELSMAQLRVLYTPEELQRMIEEAKASM